MIKMRGSIIPWGFMFLVCTVLPTWAANGDANILSATPSYAALFKNGVGLVMSKVDLPDASGEFRITPFPDATLGSFWVHWGDGIRLEKIKATQVESNERVSAASVMDMMEANVGKEVELWIQDRKEWGRYTILDVPKRHDDPIVFPRSANVIPLPPPMDRGDLVLLQGPESKEAIPLGWVQAIRMYAEDHINRPKMENMVSLTSLPGTTGSPKDVSLTYLAKGIAWSPSYVLDISQEKKATITAKAVIVNDLQPLEHTHVELIAGYPNIAFSESNSSFSLVPLQETLAKIGAMAGRAEMPFSNAAVLTQRAFAMDVNAPPMPSAPMIPVMGESAEDLYFYPIQDVTLKKGERGYYPLFAEEVPYEHLYTWDIPNYLNENAPYQPDQGQNSPPQVVWHALKLTNTTGQPWTSAPASTMKEGRILGQDTLLYTASGASTELKITQAVSIHAEQNEYEIERQRSAAQFYGREYDLVTVQGELAVVNYKEEPVTIEITKTLTGEVRKSDEEPKISRLAKGLSSVNPISQLVWKIAVKPGKDNASKLTYTYQLYVRG